ncbi:MAG: hypothetical protein KC900_03495 [Candidatus Omnitrophica bacterium]|nr:hypothetical protein [Candidatus Omnitrophota bacterium]
MPTHTSGGQVSGHVTGLPQLLVCGPQAIPVHVVRSGSSTQPEQELPLQTAGETQVSGHTTNCPQLFTVEPHSNPAQVVAKGSGVQQVLPWHTSGEVHPPQSTAVPQLLLVTPHSMGPEHVVAGGSSTQTQKPPWHDSGAEHGGQTTGVPQPSSSPAPHIPTAHGSLGAH